MQPLALHYATLRWQCYQQIKQSKSVFCNKEQHPHLINTKCATQVWLKDL